MAPGSPQRSVASRPSSIAAAAPDPTEPNPCSRLLICLQINQQTMAGKVGARKAALTGGLRIYRAFGAFAARLQSPKVGNSSENLLKVSSQYRRNSRFEETLGGDN